MSEIVVDLDEEVGELPAGLYACEVKNMEYKNSKNGIPFIVVSLEVDEGPYTGATVQDWISQDPDQKFNIKAMNSKRLKGFIRACLNGDEATGTLRFTETEDPEIAVAEDFVGNRVGAYLAMQGDYLKVDRAGYVPVADVDNDDEDPFD